MHTREVSHKRTHTHAHARTRTNTNTIKCLYRFMKNAYSALLFLCPISEHLKLPPRLLVGEPLPIPRCRVASYRHGLWDRRSEGSWVSCPKCVTCSHVAFLTIYKSLSYRSSFFSLSFFFFLLIHQCSTVRIVVDVVYNLLWVFPMFFVRKIINSYYYQVTKIY